MSDKKRQLKLTDLLGPGPSKVQKIHENDEQQPDGSVLVKETERSRPLVVKGRQDIYRLGGEILNGDEED